MDSIYTYYLTYDLPIPYKNISIHPAMMKDYFMFHAMASCLFLEKDSVPDVKVISMKYLEYLFYSGNNENKNVGLLYGLLRLVLKRDDISFGLDKSNKPVIIIGTDILDCSDFDEIRNIIGEQNCLEFPDESIQKTVRDKIREAEEYKAKINGSKTATLEERILALSIYTGWELKQIYELPIRKFVKAVRRADHILHYEIYLAASMSGMVEFKDKSFIKHWLVDIEPKDKHGNSIVNLEDLQSQVNFDAAK